MKINNMWNHQPVSIQRFWYEFGSQAMVTSKIWVICNPNMCDSSNIRTPPKFNIEAENDGLEDDFPFPGV